MGRIRAAAAILCCAIATGVCAQVNIMMPWVRGTVAGQQSTAAFMQLE